MNIRLIAISATALSVTLILPQPSLRAAKVAGGHSFSSGSSGGYRPSGGLSTSNVPYTHPTYSNQGSGQGWSPQPNYYRPNNSWTPNTSNPTYSNYPAYSNYPNYTPVTPTPSYTPAISNYAPTTPQPNYLPSSPPPAVTNVLPNQVPQPVVQTQVAANQAYPANIFGITDKDIRSAQSQVTDKNNQIASNIASEIASISSNEIANDPAFKAALPPAAQSALLQAVKNGDPATVQSILTANNVSGTPTGNALLADAGNVQSAQNLATAASNGTATQQQINNLATVLNSYGFSDAASNIASLAANNKIAGLLQTAKPGDNSVPSGDDVPIVLVSGLPDGTICPFGNGAVMIGTGGATDGTLVGDGNVAEVTGQPQTVGPPTPNSQAEAVASGVLLTNGTDAQLNYQLNDNSYTMGPRYQQPLPSGQSWVIAFDRGGSFGQARYTLGEGTYQFANTDHGWDLQKQTFSATLDNTFNKTPFNYVLQNAQQSVPAGQSSQLTSDYPLIVRFDDGKGQTIQKQLASGSYSIAAQPGAGIDLYPPDAVKPPVSGPSTFSVVNGKQQRLPVGFRLFDTAIHVALTQAKAGDTTSDGVKPLSLFSK